MDEAKRQANLKKAWAGLPGCALVLEAELLFNIVATRRSDSKAVREPPPLLWYTRSEVPPI